MTQPDARRGAANAARNLPLDGGRLRLVRLSSAAVGARRALCFPFAGGGPFSFRPFAARLPADWVVWAVDPPGHVRTSGEPLTDVARMCDVYLEHLPQHVFDQALLVGHSLGGYVAFAMAQRLERLGRPAAGVIISGARPPHRRDPERPLAPMPRPELFDWLSRLGGLPGEPNDQRAFFELYEESIRADLCAFDSFDPGARRLERTPLRAVGATRDPLAPAAEFPEWARYAATASTTIVEGEHLFVVDAPGLTADAVVPFVDALPRPAPAAAPLEVGP